MWYTFYINTIFEIYLHDVTALIGYVTSLKAQTFQLAKLYAVSQQEEMIPF